MPVLDTVLNTVAKDLDGVPTELSRGLCTLVDSAGVGRKIRVDSEGTGDGSVLDELRHDVLLASNRVSFFGKVLIVVERSAVVHVLARKFVGVIAVVDSFVTVCALAWGDGVRPTGIVIVVVLVVTTRDHTVVLKVLPGVGGLLSVATKGETAQEAAARGDVLGGQQLLEITVGGNAQAVVEGLHGGESPARPTVGLITDMTNDTIALGKGLTCIEILRKLIGLDCTEVGGFRQTDLLLALDERTT